MQASENKIKRIDELTAIGTIFSSLPTMLLYDDMYIDYLSNMVSDVVSLATVYRLECLPDVDAVFTVYDRLYE